MTDQKNMLLAIILSGIVLFGWQYFVGMPQMEKQRREAELKRQQEQSQLQPGNQPGAAPSTRTLKRSFSLRNRSRKSTRSSEV